MQLLDEKQDTDNRDLFDLEHVERTSSVAAEHDSDLGTDQELEEMDSQLNPDAKEFVPVSPQRTSVSSPFGNGGGAGIHGRLDLMDDDIVSQSPRKGSGIVMDDDNIVLPAENEFKSEISQRPSELETNQTENGDLLGGVCDALKDAQRPESVNSQCSYQEMNLKEAMHGDEKQELAAEVQDIDNMFGGSGGGDCLVPTTNGDQQFLNEQHPMNMSFYNDENNPFSSGEVDMNAVQPLPDDIDDDENEIVDYVAQPVELNKSADQFGQIDDMDKFNQSQNVEESTPITDIVQALATEVTSILHVVEQETSDQQPMETENIGQSDGKSIKCI